MKFIGKFVFVTALLLTAGSAFSGTLQKFDGPDVPPLCIPHKPCAF